MIFFTGIYVSYIVFKCLSKATEFLGQNTEIHCTNLQLSPTISINPHCIKLTTFQCI